MMSSFCVLRVNLFFFHNLFLVQLNKTSETNSRTARFEFLEICHVKQNGIFQLAQQLQL